MRARRLWAAALWGSLTIACDDGSSSGGADAAGTTDARVTSDAASPPPDGGDAPDRGAREDAGPRPDDGGPGADAGIEGCVALADGRCVVETWRDVPLLQPDVDGIYQLEMVPTEFSFNGQRHCARSYNGMYPSPTIDVPAMAPGAPRKVRVDVRNRFTRSDFVDIRGRTCTCTDLASEMSCEPEGHGPGHTCHCVDDAGEECHMFDFNLTNLHAHGSHVRPDYATGGGCVEEDGLRCRACAGDRDDGPHDCFHGDDVLSQIPPGVGARHRWDLDEDGVHHEGLHWYHPHIHGSTAIQVASGATGALIVRGPVDELPGVARARERVMVFTTPPTGYTPLADGEPCDEDHLTFNDFTVLSETSSKQTNLINGVRRPRLIMPPGQIERWRFLHGAFLDESAFALYRGNDADCQQIDFDAGPVPLVQIARDGITMPRPASGEDWPFAPPYFFVSPGYRIDMLLDGGQLADGDTLCLVAARFLQDDETSTSTMPVSFPTAPTLSDILRLLTNGDLVAIVNVTAAAGEPTETQMPDLADVAEHAPSLMLQDGTLDALERCAEVKAIEDVDAIEQVAAFWMLVTQEQGEGFDGCACPDHNVNCRNFELTDRTRYPYDRVLPLGAVEHWRLVAGFDGHPFHIHINPFLACPLPPAGADDRNTKSRLFEPPFAHWRDTYLVNLDRAVDLLSEYKTHTGDFVFHCHKLNHEDHGMMELIRICDPATEACDTLCDGGPCGWRDCAEGDAGCERARAATECTLDASKCPEALMRCTACQGQDRTCPPGGRCADVLDVDGERRCVPGCAEDADCPPTEACQDGACVPAPCAPPCPPMQRCVHGACE